MARPGVSYATEANSLSVSGSQRETLTVVVDLRVEVARSGYNADEIILMVNGRQIKRMTKTQAMRLGIIPENADDGY